MKIAAIDGSHQASWSPLIGLLNFINHGYSNDWWLLVSTFYHSSTLRGVSRWWLARGRFQWTNGGDPPRLPLVAATGMALPNARIRWDDLLMICWHHLVLYIGHKWESPVFQKSGLIGHGLTSFEGCIFVACWGFSDINRMWPMVYLLP